MLGVYFFLSCLLLSCAANECPACPENPYSCSYQYNFGDPCPCGICLTLCSIREPVCKKGEACSEEEVYFGKELAGTSAVCKPFSQCPQIQCPLPCPESGYFVDHNGCTTCLCKDPCKELKCPGPCGSSSVTPLAEPYYQCLE